MDKSIGNRLNCLNRLKTAVTRVSAWAVEGCLAWQREGLIEPPDVRNSVDAWKCENDPLKEFFEDECEFDPAVSTPVADMWRRYNDWAAANGVRNPSRSELQNRLQLRGCTKAVIRNAGGRQERSWKGVKVI
jgi:putative DNA primase/helicase